MIYLLKVKKWNPIYMVDRLWEVPQNCWFILRENGQKLINFFKQNTYSEINRMVAVKLIQAGLLERDKPPF